MYYGKTRITKLRPIHLQIFVTGVFSASGPVAVSTPAKLVSPGYVINGTMSVTKSELYFEMDDDDEENKKIDPKVRHCRTSFIYTERKRTRKRIFFFDLCSCSI